MTSARELVAVYTEDGVPLGGVPRAQVRAEGLWHACASILVRSADGSRVYVHKRTDTKDVYPGLYDCWAGGVLGPDESPDLGAARELLEELGVDAPVTPLFRTRFDDPPIRYVAHLYEARTDGPFTHQPTEVVSGEWVSLAALRALANDPSWPVVPDGRAFILEWFARREG